MSLVKAYYPPGFHFLPSHPSKSLKFYRDILFETKSITIKPIPDKKDPTKILYHSLYIVRIISLSQWGDPPFTYHKCGDLSFNYYDYEEAWNTIFLHQTDDSSHSWFLNFDFKFNRQFPMWFLGWWRAHGCPFDILPQEIKNAVTCFSTVMNFTNYDLNFPVALHFMAKYKLPWIFKWHYEVKDHVVSRHFLVKWWDNFKIERIISQFNEEFPVTPAQPSQSRSPVTPMPTQLASTSQSKPQSHKLPSSSKSKGKAKSDTSSKSEELKELAKKLLEQAANLSNDEDEEEEEEEASSRSSSSSHSHPGTPGKTARWADYQDSQDPYEDFE
jgi:hypothetical protein